MPQKSIKNEELQNTPDSHFISFISPVSIHDADALTQDIIEDFARMIYVGLINMADEGVSYLFRSLFSEVRKKKLKL